MKKLFMALIAIIFVTTLAGCNNTNEAAEVKKELNACYSSVESLNEINSGLNYKYSTLSGDFNKVVEALNECSIKDTTGSIVTGVLETGTVVIKDMFPMQPTKAIGNYTSNTKQLNVWAHNNMRQTTGYINSEKMVVLLKKPVADRGRNLILYVNPIGIKWYCGGRIIGNVVPGTQKFVFDLNNIEMKGTTCDGDWTNYIRNKKVKVGGYITEYNGNGIASIYFE